MSIVREWMSMKYKIPRMQESADQGDVLDLQGAHLTCHLPLCSAFLSLGHRQTPNPFCYEGRPRNTPFQSAMPFRAVLRAKLPDDPLAAAKRVWIPGPQSDDNPTILVLLREDPPPPTHYTSWLPLTFHAHHCHGIRPKKELGGCNRVNDLGVYPKVHIPENRDKMSIPWFPYS